jgi:hypothetical protein
VSPPLPTGFIARVRALKATLDEVFPKSFEDWVQGFELDCNPEKELLIWECMTLAYNTFTEGRTLSIQAQKEAFQVTLQYSLGRTDEYILKNERKVLHTAEIRALVDCYHAAAETVFAIKQGREAK